jgi:hypothetical protein
MLDGVDSLMSRASGCYRWMVLMLSWPGRRGECCRWMMLMLYYDERRSGCWCWLC